jgi:glutathione S-transferase
MSRVEVIYFAGLKARGAPIKVALHHAGVEFTDTQVAFSDWATLKPSIPSGSLPVIKKDGRYHSETSALLRWAGKKSELYPTGRFDDDQALAIDTVIDVCQCALSSAPQHADPEEKKRLREEYAATKLAVFCEQLAVLVGGAGGFAAGPQFSIADLAIYYVRLPCPAPHGRLLTCSSVGLGVHPHLMIIVIPPASSYSSTCCARGCSTTCQRSTSTPTRRWLRSRARLPRTRSSPRGSRARNHSQPRQPRTNCHHELI